MKDVQKLLVGLIMGVCIYYLALYVVPSLRLFEGLLKLYWIDKGTLTQLTLLVVSLILMLILSKGCLSVYGFRSIRIAQLVKPVLICLPVAFLLIVIAGILAVLTGGMTAEGEGSAIGKSLLQRIVSIVVIASICEEIFTRGLIQSFLSTMRRYGFRLFRLYISVPVVIVALGFGLGHLCLLGSMPDIIVINVVISATVLGFIAGYYREQTGSLIPAVVAHMSFNVVGLIISSLMGG